MFTKYKQDVKHLDPKKGVNKPFDNVFIPVAYSESFLLEGGHQIYTFFENSFCLKQIDEQKRLLRIPAGEFLVL